MAITYPLNLLDDLPGWTTNFELMYRQEQSRHASGRTRVKDFGTPIWTATYVTKNLSPNKIDYWKARLNTLENGLNTFVAYPFSRCWPIAHPNGLAVNTTGWVLDSGNWNDGGIWLDGISWTDNALSSGRINSVNANNKAISIKEIANLKLSIGDYVSINGRLYQIVEDVPSSGSAGVTNQFEVRPQLSLGTSVNDPILIHQPFCLMTLVPGSVSSSVGINGRGSISFQGIEARG